MTSLLLVPLEDVVVFPNMTVTLPVDVGDEERVLLVPVHEGEYAKVGTVAEVSDTVRLPGGARAAQLTGLHRGVAGAAHTDASGRLRVEVEERPDEELPGIKTRELEREYRAVAEEILELRGDDGRVAAFLRAIVEPGTLADTVGYSPDFSFAQKTKVLETVDVVERLELAVEMQRERLAEMQVRKRIRDDVEEGASKQQREYILRKQMESIRKELGEDDGSAADDYRAKIEEAGMPDAVREQAERELARLERMGDQTGESSMIRTYLDWLIAVPWAKRSEERLDPGARARGAGRRPRRPRGREGPRRRVPGRAQAARGARDQGGQALRRDPHPDRPSRHRQDLDRRVDRPRAQPRVRAHVARRHPRRGRDPRPPAHLHRRAAGPARPRPARRRDDEPGDPARRGRQGRRRLARRPVRGAARGARPGAEPLVPRPLPRRRARPLRGHLHRDRERRRHDPRPAARPHGGDPLRRVHRGREGRDRARLPVAAPARAQRPARGRGRDLGRAARADRHPVHARGGRPPARARARHAAPQDRDRDRLGQDRAAGDRRRARRARRAQAAAVLPGGGRAHRGARRRDRPRRDRHRRRRALRRGDADAERSPRGSSSPASSAT